ncbi:hypothetical protein IAD21_01360 [Abditibacteriota bacterium]|nr:hypothetical protein IAD21_01360 [Abditibacteriota bacterium]
MNPVLNSALDIHILWAIYNHRKVGEVGIWPAAGYSLWWMLEGEVQIWSGEKCWTVEQGQLFLWPKNLPRRIVGVTNVRWMSIGLSAGSVYQPDLMSLLELPGVHTPQSCEHFPIVRWMENLIELDDYEFKPEGVREFSGRWEKSSKLRPAHFDVIEDSMARAIFGWCWGMWGTVDLRTVLNQQPPLWLQKAVDLIGEEPTVPIAKLAKLSNFSPAQFRRLFHQHMKQSPQQYLLNNRLDIAQRLLLTTNLPIDEVAVRSGFPTPTNFMKLWKRERGLSALQYRLALKASHQ